MSTQATTDDRKPFGPVPVSALRRTALDGNYDPGVNDLLPEELEYIAAKREGAKRTDLAGLALSGGGIRSATFALGVMQALARTGVLARMDYLSTVSGGGYIGSALTWLLGPRNPKDESGKDRFGLDKCNFPFGIDSGRDSAPIQAAMLNWLRQHGNYLTPGEGITLTSGIAVVLRGILLNLIVWVPLGAIFLIGAIWLGGQLVASLKLFTLIPSTYADALTEYYCALGPNKPICPGPKDSAGLGIVLICFLIAAATMTLFVLVSIFYSLGTCITRLWDRTAEPAEPSIQKESAEAKTDPSPAEPGKGIIKYRLRRSVESSSRPLLWIPTGCVLFASVPVLHRMLEGLVAAEGGGVVAVISGAIGGGWSFLRTLRGDGDRFQAPLAIVAAVLILYGLGLVCYGIAEWALNPGMALSMQITLGFAALALVLGIVVNINYISIHRFYRDRLMEAFLPDPENAKAGKTGPAKQATNASLFRGKTPHTAPYHIINTNLILVNSKDRRRSMRGGDNFILGSAYSGSNATGWFPTNELGDGNMTLASAMAISGAAANPNAGCGGTGLTRNRAVSLLMALLNLRLGFWLPNPQSRYRPIVRCPNHFRPGMTQAFGGHHETASFIELSDGGHFENLGLYELVRRRLRLIIVCDGGADPSFSFSDLNTIRRRIAADFGARIEFEPGHDPEQLIPRRLRETAPDGAGYAVDADMAERGFLLGHIEYADGTKGKLIYLKTTMTESLGFGVKAYKGAHHDFPDQTTADQFFDEEQFDAYLELGRDLAKQMIEDSDALAILLGFVTNSHYAYGLLESYRDPKMRPRLMEKIADEKIRERVEYLDAFLADPAKDLLDEINNEELCVIANAVNAAESESKAKEIIDLMGSRNTKENRPIFVDTLSREIRQKLGI